mmetsp:Transcript_13365/g.19682  ORF Transcript_13365/g.19682 Transcript_13365/m.19682 type:complete len:314 (-) Transcript_13365:75-1016(-)|eukprot:CAMPEP_0194222792 /NCGR_PEP_ID=MMETSP0156-20130528/33771_1 /TAXON_ID=33649 /ORGANISM="Thalassionema nitzschioides, Strain L26-B" /LENGTH=313 /DNA_ID=CAMNT_0038953727 /DNA_START=85 /DNA_END=1026 /DNA_ORIENTATION=+
MIGFVTSIALFSSLFVASNAEGWNLRGFTNDNHRSLAIETTDATTERTGVADGCFHVYLDVGSNIGVHTRFLYEPHLYPEAQKAAKIFDTNFGPPAQRDNRDICVFTFEPNPAQRHRFEVLEEAYTKAGWRFKAYMAGVGAKEGSMTFYHNDADPNEHSEWGFSTSKWGGPAVSEEVVPIMDLTKWLETEILNRKMPEDVYGSYATNEGKVVMKMDIEAQEYLVLPKLMLSNVMCQTIDHTFMEEHSSFFQFTQDPSLLSLGLKNIAEARQFWDSITKAFGIYKTSTPACKSVVELLDDESYVNDGIPGGLIP